MKFKIFERVNASGEKILRDWLNEKNGLIEIKKIVQSESAAGGAGGNIFHNITITIFYE